MQSGATESLCQNVTQDTGFQGVRRVGMSIDWAPMAEVDLQGIGDKTVIAELIHLATTELDLRFLPDPSEDQGTVREVPEPGVAWRRGIKRDAAWAAHAAGTLSEDGSRNRACDYVLVYRPPEPSEYMSAAASDGRKVDFIITRVLPAREYAQYLTLNIAEEALQLGDLWTQLLRSSERLL